jgi:two-component system alkaline phosphatase synthesis response regulator PhoP/two-component system response regulator ResD
MPEVLVVDDDPNLRAMIRFTLEGGGFDVRTAADGIDALTQLKDGPCPDVVLLDLMMPRLDGLGVLREMRRLNLAPESHVVILTCKVEELDFVRGFELGATEYLNKPFDPEALVEKLHSLLITS